MKMENTVNNNFEEIFYDDFIRFVNDGLLNKLDKSVFTFLKDCGYIDTINLQGFRYLPKSGECELIDQSWSDFVAVIIEKIDGAENGSAAGSEIISSGDGKAQMLKLDFDGRGCIAIPVFRIDEDAVYAKKLSLADKNIFLDKSNHYKAGYLFFIVESCSAAAGPAGSNYSGFITVFLKSVIEIFDSLLTVRSQLDYKTRESNDYQLLLNVSGSIISTLDLNEVLQGIVDGATESLNSARGSLMLIDDSSGELVLRYGKGMKPELINNVRVKIGEGIAGSVAKSGEPLLIRDIENADRFKKKSAKEFNNKSLLSVPLKANDRVIGVFNINNKITGEVYDEFDLKILKALSNQAAISIQNAKHYQKAIETQAELEEQIEASSNLYEEVHTLYEIVRATTALNDPKSDPRDRILELATETLGATTGFLFLPQENNSIKATYVKGQFNDAFQFSTIFQSDENLITRVIQSLQSVLITTGADQSVKIEPEVISARQYREDSIVSEISQFINHPVRSLLIVPLFDENSISIGVILLVNKNVTGNFTEPNRNLLQILGQQISSIIRDKNLLKEYLLKQTIEKEIDVAHSIQQKLIPKQPPAIPGIDIFAINKPAKTVSGDYYDFLRHDSEGKKIGLVIADVSGKGIPAAMIMSMTRAILKTQVADNFSPASILQRSNSFIISDMENNRYVTMFYGMLDTENFDFTYSKAGHNPPYWMHGETLEIEELDANGFFVGMFDIVNYEEKKIRLLPKDKIILFTDGIVEAMNDRNEEYGPERFIEIIRKYHYFDARSLVDKILMDVEAFVAGAPQSDDLTLMILNAADFEYSRMTIESDAKSTVATAEFFGALAEKNPDSHLNPFEVMMIIDEIVMNAIEHGNKFDPEKKVHLTYVFNEYKFELTVLDEGEGFKVNNVFATHEKLSLYDKRGRGILIIKNLVDRIEYNKEGNEVRIVKYFK
jgi:sigma-B regulation protein RsbU (phosphoserine phosphatase)